MRNNNEKIDRQIELLGKYYPIDREKKLVTVTLRYEKVTDLLSEEVGISTRPQLNPEVLEKINRIIPTIPLGYQIELEFDVKDYEGFEPHQIMETFNDALEMNQYGIKKQKRGNWFLATILTVIGILFLLLMGVVSEAGWFQGARGEIFSEILDIIAWVFIWEAVSLLFLTHSEQDALGIRVRNRVASIALYQQDSEDVLAKENALEIFGHWEDDSRAKRMGEWFTLFSSAAFLCMACYNLFLTFSLVKQEMITSMPVPVFVLLSVFFSIIHLLAGFGGLAKYMGKKNLLSKFVGPYAIVMFVVIIASIILSAVRLNITLLVSSISSFVINIFYVAGYLIDRYFNRTPRLEEEK